MPEAIAYLMEKQQLAQELLEREPQPPLGFNAGERMMEQFGLDVSDLGQLIRIVQGMELAAYAMVGALWDDVDGRALRLTIDQVGFLTERFVQVRALIVLDLVRSMTEKQLPLPDPSLLRWSAVRPAPEVLARHEGLILLVAAVQDVAESVEPQAEQPPEPDMMVEFTKMAAALMLANTVRDRPDVDPAVGPAIDRLRDLTLCVAYLELPEQFRTES